MLVAGIDVSTATTKAILYDLVGKELASGEKGYEISSPQPGWAEQDAELWWNAVVESVRGMLRSFTGRAADISALSITHQRYTFVPVDRMMKPIYPGILWCDNRCGKEAEWVSNSIGDDEVYRTTGYVPHVWGVYKILWLKRHKPEIYEQTYKWMVVQDYIVYLLTGEVVTTSSSAIMMGCLDVTRTTEWADDFIRRIGLDPEKFVRRVEPAGKVLGYTTKEASGILGINPRTPVYSSAGDQPCGCVGAGVHKPGIVGINGGTSCTIQGVTREVPKSMHKFILEISPTGNYAPEVAIHSGASMLMKWLKQKILHLESMDWESFYGLAGDTPVGNNGLVLIPYMKGVEVPYWDADAKGILFGLGIDHGVPNLVRAIIEGLALETRQILKLLDESIEEPIDRISMYGGSAVNVLWNQTFADVMGIQVQIPASKETTALGAAMCCAVGLGEYKDFTEAVIGMTKIIKVYDPIPANFELYSSIFANVYEPFYGRVKDLVHRFSMMIA